MSFEFNRTPPVAASVLSVPNVTVFLVRFGSMIYDFLGKTFSCFMAKGLRNLVKVYRAR